MIDVNDQSISAIVETASRLRDRVLRDKESERDEYPYAGFARDAVAAADEAGLLWLSVPEDAGGVGLPSEVWALVLEQAALADAGIAASLLAHAMAARAVSGCGSEDIRKNYLAVSPPKLLGYSLYVLAEDLSASPVFEDKDGNIVLKGKAGLVANAPVAEAAVVAVRDSAGTPALVLIPLGDGKQPRPVETLGLRSCPAGTIDLGGMTLPATNILARGKDAVSALHAEFIPAAVAVLLASLKSSLDYAIEYGRERYQGGRMIHEHTQLRSMYGQMAVEHAVLREAWLRSLEKPGDVESRMAMKALAGELALRGCTDGVQLLGGYGYTMDYPQERKMRDSRQAAEILGSPLRTRLKLIDRIMG